MHIFRPKYKAHKSEAVKNLEALNDGNVFVPKWALAIGITTLVGLAVVFSASIAISVTKQPNGLYQESCEKRSCEIKLGLKCLNKICLCPESQFYLDKCYNLSTYGEICQKNEHCKSEENLLCGITSKCDCDLENYWNANSKKCVSRKSYLEACNGDECKSELSLACQSGICDCQSKQTKYWNGSSCLDKKKFNESCGTSNECLDSEGTLCLNSKYVIF
ncbi:hypothetical protein BpHYR1_047363 [Brachionus plicatilis]|uniref:Prion-like-(Q N-rich) domain-bearing 25 n=1 Tax=Brachionus plicatilis TaxID=10195 RepID=A0A3M7RTX5_BRAPC|nr:hypothetical protein BpHYR1_047363 [Brachionus plicatilis]